MTDIMAGRIIRDVVTPKFKAGDLSGGIVAGVDAIVTQLDMDPAQAQAIEEAERARQAQQADDAAPAGPRQSTITSPLCFSLSCSASSSA
jgi:uncharacterized protein